LTAPANRLASVENRKKPVRPPDTSEIIRRTVTTEKKPVRTVFIVIGATLRAIPYYLFKELPAQRLNRKAGVLRQRYKTTRALTDLDSAIALIEKAVRLVDPGSPNQAIYLTNLGLALQSRYDKVHRVEDIDRAIESLQRAVAMTPSESPQQASRTDWLLRAMQTRGAHR
jgi:tetratricopeptide (TPR) repeat protein